VSYIYELEYKLHSTNKYKYIRTTTTL